MMPDWLQNLLAGSGLVAITSVLVAVIGQRGKKEEAKTATQQSLIDDLAERVDKQDGKIETLTMKVEALQYDLYSEQTHSHRLRLRLDTFLDYLRRVTAWRAEQPPEHLVGAPDLPDIEDLEEILAYQPTYRARDDP